jgi:hypothetical protein
MSPLGLYLYCARAKAASQAERQLELDIARTGRYIAVILHAPKESSALTRCASPNEFIV